MEQHAITKLQEWAVVPTAYRKDVGCPLGIVKKDATWIGASKTSSHVKIRIYEEFVINEHNDAFILSLKANGKSISTCGHQGNGPLGDAMTTMK